MILRNSCKEVNTAVVAKTQIVVLGQNFLDWIISNPHSSCIGGLFKDSTKVIGLLLGISKDHVKAEHRSILLTFAVWKFLLVIKPNDHEGLSQSLARAVSSMMPNQMPLYVLPRSVKKFKIWPQPVQDKVLLILSERVSSLGNIQVMCEVFKDEALLTKISIQNKDVQVVNEFVIEVKLPEQMACGTGVKFKLQIGR